MWACEIKISYFTKNRWKMSGDLRFHKSMKLEFHTYFVIFINTLHLVFLIKIKKYITYNSAIVLYCYILYRFTNSYIEIHVSLRLVTSSQITVVLIEQQVL